MSDWREVNRQSRRLQKQSDANRRSDRSVRQTQSVAKPKIETLPEIRKWTWPTFGTKVETSEPSAASLARKAARAEKQKADPKSFKAKRRARKVVRAAMETKSSKGAERRARRSVLHGA
jgi:hypothetical protein